MPFEKPLQVFVCYAREDSDLVKRLRKHLLSLEEDGVLEVWWDPEIPVGKPWDGVIQENLGRCDIFLALTSASFQDSTYIQQKELAAALERERQGLCRIVPVKLHPWRPPQRLSSLQFLLNARSVDSFANVEEALTTIAGDLQRIADEMAPAMASRGRGAEVAEYLRHLIEVTEAKAELYSPLHGVSRKRPWESLLGLWDRPVRCQQRRAGPAEAGPSQDYPDVLAAFAELKRGVVLGAPGAGKSTTLRRLAVNLARTALNDATAPVPHLAYLGDWSRGEPLAQFLARSAPPGGFTANGHAVLLLDGLNEMPNRGAKAGQIRELAKTAMLFVSCREEDYTGELDLGMDTLTLDPLTPPQIRAAVGKWVSLGEQPPELADRFFWQLAGDPALAGVREWWLAMGFSEEAFWSAKSVDEFDLQRALSWEDRALWKLHIPDPRSLIRLASNPLLLTMLFQVWADAQGALPRNRGDLFRLFVEELLHREKLAPPEGERLLRGLADLAWGMQHRRSLQDGAGVLTVIPRTEALQVLGPEFLKKAIDGTLLEGGAELRFRHQLLQEYFTARALRQRIADTPARQLWPAERWWERSGWEETAVLLAGLYAEDCTEVIRWLGDAQPEVAAQCILESGAGIGDEKRLLEELHDAWSSRLLGDPMPEARAAIGRALARLNLDRRKGVGVKDGLPDIDWVEIPGGKFLYQEEKKPRKIATFRMARYPVTNAQFDAFLQAADGYHNHRWWRDGTDADRKPGGARMERAEPSAGNRELV